MFLPIQPVRFLGRQTTRHPAKEGVPCSAGLAHVRVRIQRRAVTAQSCQRCGVAGMADSGMIRLGRRAVRGAWPPAGQHRDGVFGARADTHVAWDQCALYSARGLPDLRRWWVSGIALLGVAGGLAVLASQARTVPPPRAPLETAVRVAARASKPGLPSLPSLPPSPTGSETVSTAAEAAQAIQRFRTAHTARAVSLADDGLPPVPLTPLPVPPDPDPATQQ